MRSEVKFNLQQQPKTPGYMACFRARPGMRLVQADLSSIEPRVIAEFSQDPMLMKLYGPDAKPNDVYIFNGAHIELFREQLREFYDPYNPTPEGIKKTKEKYKLTRGFCKEITLAAGYGASANRLRLSLITKGYPITMKEAEIIHRDYWNLYPGIMRFQKELEKMWAMNGGWFPNISGRPICVAEKAIKDVCNRFAQSSGHDVLQLFLYYTQQLRRERKIEMYPWIPDLHDEQIWEVPNSNVEAVCQLLRDAIELVNQELNMGVRIEGEPEVSDNLAQIKCPDEYKEWVKQTA